MSKKKDSRVEIRLSAIEKSSCEIRAAQAKLTLSEWIRRRCLMDLPKPQQEKGSA